MSQVQMAAGALCVPGLADRSERLAGRDPLPGFEPVGHSSPVAAVVPHAVVAEHAHKQAASQCRIVGIALESVDARQLVSTPE